MSQLEGAKELQLVPRQADWIDGLAIAWRKRGIARCLRRLRETMEREAETSVVDFEAPVACTLYDDCQALKLTEPQARAVLGDIGWETVVGR